MRHLPPPFAHLLLGLALTLLSGLSAVNAQNAQSTQNTIYANASDAHVAVSQHFTEAQWQVVESPGFSTPPPTLDPNTLPDNWRVVMLPHALPIALIRQAASPAAPMTTRTTWYKLSAHNLPAASSALALYGARVKTDGTVAVYIDGRLVHRAQSQGLLWNSSRTPLWVVLEQHQGDAPMRDILIRVEHTRNSQVALSSLWLGPTDSLSWRYHMRLWLQQNLPAMFDAAYLAVGLFALFVWFRRPLETGYLFFFALAVVSFARGLHVYVDFPVTNGWFAWLTVNSLLWLITLGHFSLGLLHRRRQMWLTCTLVGVTSVIGLLSLPVVVALPNTPRVTPLIFAVAALMGAAVGITGVVSSWRRSSEGMLVAVGIVVCVLLGATDWLLQNNFISPEGLYLGGYTNAITFGVFGYLMNRRYTGAIADVEQANDQLEQQLRTREAELAESYERLRGIEKRQLIGDERQRLTQDMHDGLGSSLVSALRAVEAGRITEAEVADVLKSCIDDLKLTIDSMEPVEADLLLLLATLRYRLGPRLAASGIRLRWEVVDVAALDWLDPGNALHILRTLQEAFANILKHTQATEICVSTGAENDGVTVTIADNGQGFDVDKALHSGGKGFNNQLRRAQFLGGRVSWQSDNQAGGHGASMTLWLPIKRVQRS